MVLSYPGIPLGYQDWVGRITYNYALRYLLEFNMGRNGSENFPVNNRFGWFPAISAGWIVTSEPTVEKLIGKNILSYLKLRASYGEVGNDRMGSLRFMYYPAEYVKGGYGVLGERILLNIPLMLKVSWEIRMYHGKNQGKWTLLPK